jgi:hypothetical protein
MWQRFYGGPSTAIAKASARPIIESRDMSEPSGAGAAREAPDSSPRWLAWLFIASSLALLIPIWSVTRVPTMDGPCHLYNAWVMRHLHDPAYPLLARHFRVDPTPIPNWLIQATLYLLLAVVQPAPAEKILLTAYAALFALAVWRWAGCRGPRGHAFAFLGLPYAYNAMVLFGFYNFALSVPLCLLALATWWRGRARPDFRFALRVNALLLLCYFAHLVSLAVALLAIGVLWLADRANHPRRLWWRHPFLLLPQLPLPLLFASGNPGAVTRWSLAQLAGFLGRQGALFMFQRDLLGLAVAVLFAALLLVSLIDKARRPPDKTREAGESPLPFVLAALAAIALYLVAPNTIGAGGWISPRLSLFPFLLLLPALPHALTPRLRAAIALAGALLAIADVNAVTRRQHELAREVEAYLAGLLPVAPDSRVLALTWERAASFDRAVVGHAIGYLGIRKGLVDWDNYQAFSGLFPVRAVKGLPHPAEVDFDPDRLPLLAQRDMLDYVYTWGMPARSPLRADLVATYQLVRRRGLGELWRRQP